MELRELKTSTCKRMKLDLPPTHTHTLAFNLKKHSSKEIKSPTVRPDPIKGLEENMQDLGKGKTFLKQTPRTNEWA